MTSPLESQRETTSAPPQTVAAEVSDATIGKQIGPYRVLGVIGEGGFGIVYEAERREPMVQTVALKVIKPGMESKSIIARFEQERQALAMMDHPNVAKVFDAGATPQELGSRPYFVMELVRGEPITEYCDRNRLTVRQRLELFIPVCDAVQHAHMKGLIHRDLKPSNILVAISDDRPIPKVIDFGVAKAISHTIASETIFTERGQLIGTPEYMSPEQAEMGALDIDTRSDVYSLGVILYELLTGLLPFDSREIRRRGIAAIQQMIREAEPPTPSHRLSSVAGDDGAMIARNRQSERDSLERQLRSELEWLPLMAMRKDRARRYRSASDLADDVRRYLGGQALEAGPESASYRARKFLHRHRGAVVASTAVLLALVAGLSGTSAGMAWAIRERNTARVEARKQEWMNAQLTLLLAAFDTGDEATRSIQRIGTVLETMRRIGMDKQPEAVLAYARRADMRIRTNVPGAIEDLNAAIALGESLMADGPDRDMFQGFAVAVPVGDFRVGKQELRVSSTVAECFRELEVQTIPDGELVGLEQLLARRALVEQALPADSDLNDTLLRLGNVRMALGRTEEARTTLRAALKTLKQRDHGNPNHAGSAYRYRDIAVALAEAGDGELAVGILSDALAAYQSGLSDDRLVLLEGTARVYRTLHLEKEARNWAVQWDTLLQKQEAFARQNLANWWTLVRALDDRCTALEWAGKDDDAERILNEALTISLSNRANPDALGDRTRRLAKMVTRRNQPDRAATLFANLETHLVTESKRKDLDAYWQCEIARELLELPGKQAVSSALAIAKQACEGPAPLRSQIRDRCLDTLALAYSRSGDLVKAADVQRTVVQNLDLYDHRRFEYQARLAAYTAGKTK